jgi:hypothetical protein
VKNKVSTAWLIFVGLCLFVAPILRAQEAWRELGLSIPTLRAIGIPATAECNGQKMKAYVVLWGHVKPDGMGYPSMGIFVENLSEVIPPVELEQFDPTHMPDVVIKSKTMEINLTNKTITKTLSTRVSLSGGDFFPEYVRGNEYYFFDMNLISTKSEDAAWKQFVVYMSSGFDKGHLTIGGPVFSHKLYVEFSGKGIEPLLKKLMLSVGP